MKARGFLARLTNVKSVAMLEIAGKVKRSLSSIFKYRNDVIVLKLAGGINAMSLPDRSLQIKCIARRHDHNSH
jgi:hypothetical protein